MLFDTPLSFGLKNQNGLNQRFFELRGQPATQKTYCQFWRTVEV